MISSGQRKSPAVQGFPSAPEKTRTSTDHTVHKALNLERPVSMLLRASRSSKSCGFVDVLDVMDALDVVTAVVTATAEGGGTIIT